MREMFLSDQVLQFKRMNEKPLFYYAALNDAHGTILMDEDARRHVVTVLRMQEGSHIMLMDGKGFSAEALIESANKKQLQVSIIDKKYHPGPDHKTILAISLLKNASRFEWMLEKVTEIGVTDVFPVISERTEKIHFREERMKQIMISASLQSKQMWMPVLHAPIKFDQLISTVQVSRKLIAHCSVGEKNMVDKQAQDTILLIGPEGDFTSDEISRAIGHQFLPVSLGESRLRTETAGVVGSVMMSI